MAPKLSNRAGAEESVLKRLAGGQVSVVELVGALNAEGFSRDEAVTAMTALQRDKKVKIKESMPYSSLMSYARSPLSLWFWASLAAIGASLALISVTSGAALYLRYAFGGALVLFIPGYSLIEALYPKPELDGLARLALSIGLSLALVPLVGLVLNYTPLGIRLLPTALSISCLAVLFLIFALVRKHAYYRLASGLS
jgi:uncharacterized membrane protein